MNKCNGGFPDLWQKIRQSFFVVSQKYFFPPRFPSAKLAIVAITLTLAACSGGGGGGGGGGDGGGNSGSSSGSGSSSQGFVVSGTVSAPGGAVAFNRQKNLFERFSDIFFPPTYASSSFEIIIIHDSGIYTVPDGTQVDLFRINNDGLVISTLATTQTSGGTYSFNFTKLGLSAASDLVVQVSNPLTGVWMRAFVASDTVDINPVSEATVRIVLEKAATLSLNNFTNQELADISAAVNLLIIVGKLTVGSDIESTVTSFKNIVTANDGFMTFVNAASLSGQTSEGLGDLVNYSPLAQGNTWTYRGTVSTNGGTPYIYTNTATIAGVKIINDITTVIYAETNSYNSGANEDYVFKDGRALTYYGNNDASDLISQQLVPYPVFMFPFQAVTTYENFNRSGMDLGEDIDEDGKNEKVSMVAWTTTAFEDVTVPAGSFSSCAKLETHITYTFILSSDSSVITVTQTNTHWFAPGVGIVRLRSDEQHPDTGFREITTEELEYLSFPE